MANTERQIFAENLRTIIGNSHLSQAQIADRLGVSTGTISQYVTARAFPRPEKLQKLSQILGVSPSDLTSNQHQEMEQFVPSRELLAFAKELSENPDARAIYNKIKLLDENEAMAIRTLLNKMTEGRE